MKRLLALTTMLLALALAAQPSFAVPITFVANLGNFENPPTGSTGTGTALVTFDAAADSLIMNISFTGLIGGPATAAHIHCCVAPPANVGVAIGATGFPSATSGNYSQTFDTSLQTTYTGGFLINFGGGTVAGAEAALLAGMLNGQAYFDIHNATFPGGEIRGFFRVPEPASITLLLLGLGSFGFLRKRRD